jgi:hypothetical protein
LPRPRRRALVADRAFIHHKTAVLTALGMLDAPTARQVLDEVREALR